MLTLRQRSASIVTATLVGAICGLFGGYFLTREITVWITEIRLTQYAGQLMADGEASAAELRTALAAVDDSQHDFCSTAEISYFRTLLFESEYLKDAGRMRENGATDCSAALGRRPLVAGPFKPDFRQQDGTSIYKNLPQYENSGLPAITVQRGSSFVAFMPMLRMHLEPAPLRYTETFKDSVTQRTGQLMGDMLPRDTPNLLTEGKFQLGDNLFATRCSIRFFNCATAFTTLPEIVQANKARFLGCMGLFVLLGAVTGLSISFLYRRNKSLEQQLRRAIRRQKLKVAYQPIVDLATEKIVGAEALARWTDEEDHVVTPDIFIRIAEERGFVGEITKSVVRRVLSDFAPILRIDPGFRVSVNVTAADLADPGFLEMLDHSLLQARVKAQSLTIEITESSTARQQLAMETIRSLRQRGHRVHIDDFGTGYSSLAYLHELSVDAIKIDRAFTQAIGTGSVTMAILPQILVMADALNLGVIAEGIETVQQASYFADSAPATLGQGWLFGRPMPAVDFLRLLSKPVKTPSVPRDLVLQLGSQLPDDIASEPEIIR